MQKPNREKKLEEELTALEAQYRALVKINPVSFNDTRTHMETVAKCVSDMRRIRNSKTICRPVSTTSSAWLQEIINRKDT